MSDLFGLLGLGLILLAWIPGMMETIKTKKPGMKKRFMLLYFLGSVSLAYYAFQLNSMPFIVLNMMAAAVPVAHFYYYIKKHGAKKILIPSKNV